MTSVQPVASCLPRNAREPRDDAQGVLDIRQRLPPLWCRSRHLPPSPTTPVRSASLHQQSQRPPFPPATPLRARESATRGGTQTTLIR